MNIAQLFDNYTSELASVHMHQAAVHAEADREFRRLMDQDEHRRSANISPDFTFHGHTHCFRVATNGRIFFYGFNQLTIQAQIESLVERTNRQYQWLLAEAYELFEDFLEHAYAAAALSDRNLWPLRDYGSISLNELESLSFEKLLELSRSKKDKPQSLLNPLRSKLQLLNRYESNNALGIDLWFAINFIEKLRHHIVHTKGRINSKADFTEQILKKCGLYNNGKPTQAYLDEIDSFVRPQGGAYYVRLLDVPLESIGAIQQYVRMFDELSNALPAYAHLLTSCFVQLQSKKPNKAESTAL